jgi:hypothetical protein
LKIDSNPSRLREHQRGRPKGEHAIQRRLWFERQTCIAALAVDKDCYPDYLQDCCGRETNEA